MKCFLGTVVRLLDTIKHNDTNYTQEQRIWKLQYAYDQAARHFAQPHIQNELEVKPKKLEAAIRTITGMVVYCWINASPELTSSLVIHYTYTLILDDSNDDPHPTMYVFQSLFYPLFGRDRPFDHYSIKLSSIALIAFVLSNRRQHDKTN